MKSKVQFNQLPENITIRDGRVGYLKKGLPPEQLYQELAGYAQKYYPSESNLIFKAADIIKATYQSKTYHNYKKTDYITSLYISVILSDLTRDHNIVLAGLLYSLYKKYDSFGDTISTDFGSDILSIINKTLELEAIPVEKWANNNGYPNNGLLEHIESISILLASFLYNLRTVESIPSNITKEFGEKAIFYCQLAYVLDLFCAREEIYDFLLKCSIPTFKELSMKFQEYRMNHIEEIVKFITNTNEILVNSHVPVRIEIKNGLLTNIPRDLRYEFDPQKKNYPGNCMDSELENHLISSLFIPVIGGIEYTDVINPQKLPEHTMKYLENYYSECDRALFNPDLKNPKFIHSPDTNYKIRDCINKCNQQSLSKQIMDSLKYSIKIQFIVNSYMDCWKTWGVIDSMLRGIRDKITDSSHNKEVQFIRGEIRFEEGKDNSDCYLIEIIDKKTQYFVDYGIPIIRLLNLYHHYNTNFHSNYDTFLSAIREIYDSIRHDRFSIWLESMDNNHYSDYYLSLNEKYLN